LVGIECQNALSVLMESAANSARKKYLSPFQDKDYSAATTSYLES